MLQENLLRVAEEDFTFAMEKFQKEGFDKFIQPYEHSYNTSKSQYMATISWSASQLYKLTGKPSYAEIAAQCIRYTLDCQRTEPLKDKDGTRGFFYRDKSRKSIVHYIPQLNTFSSGEMTGEMPVGIRTLGNDDVPYWPQTNNACYKEVWVTSAGKWLSLIAEY